MTFDRPEHPETSKVIGQRYEILRQLREEPWGEVWLAQDKILGVEVGLKLFPREAPGWDKAQEIFPQEAILALRLRHPQILGVFLLGKTETLLYLVQEPFTGESLLAHFARHQRFSLPQSLHLLEQVSAALALAHEQQLPHQSLNPLNLLLKGEEVRVANFAFPPVENEQALHLELKAYNPPEVLLGDQVTLASNVFSLGVLGFRLVAGSLPYPLTFDEPFPYRLETPPVDLEEIPVSLQNLLLRCLAVEPEERFPDAVQFLAQLRQVREEWGPSPGDQWAGWEPERRWKPWMDQAAEHGAKIWTAGKSFAQTWGKKALEELSNLRARVPQAPRRLWWGLGLAGLLILLVLVGNKMRQRPAPSPEPPVAATPLKLPTVGGGPPMVETLEPSPPPEAEQAETSAAAQTQTARPPAPAEAKPSPKEERYLIVAASYAKEDQARHLNQRLRAKKYNSQVVKKTSGGKTMFQVQLGPITGNKQAAEIARRLKTQEKIAPKVQKIAARSAGNPPSRRPAQ
ncbi:MAG: protein kinase [Desulfobaccales bacterium]|nr:protein kinase [Desulfobaccales bacterium]